ncbi:MAG: hypothetical protein NVS3B12_30520 [Acidimicrobiales bacterium]
MVPFASKAMFALAAVTMTLAVAYGVATDDGSAAAVLGFIAAGAFALALTVALADADATPYLPADAPMADIPPSGGRPALPSPWPLVGAIALGALALAAATDAVVVLTGVLLVTVAAFGWFFQHWSEHPTYTARYGARLKERFLVPVGLPLAVFGLVAIIAISLSRIFLALPEQGTRAVALVVAIVILGSAFVIAASERMARTALALLCGLAFLAVVGVGVAGLAAGERKFEKVGVEKQSGGVTGTPVQGPSGGSGPAGGTAGSPNGSAGGSQPGGTSGGGPANNGSGSGGAGSVSGGTPGAPRPNAGSGSGNDGAGSGGSAPSASPGY